MVADLVPNPNEPMTTNSNKTGGTDPTQTGKNDPNSLSSKEDPTVECEKKGLETPSTTASTKPPSAPPTIPIDLVMDEAKKLSTHSWEIGTCAQALLEVYQPAASVYSANPFPGGRLPRLDPDISPALQIVKGKVTNLDNDTPQLIDGDGAAGDPAAIGLAALLIGVTDARYTAACQRQADHLLNTVPRWENGAISQREDVAELWADFSFMGPPFLAYQAVASQDEDRLAQAAEQIVLQRNVLQLKRTDGAPNKTFAYLWEHVRGPQSQTLGLWSTGSGWAALGAARVLATIIGYRKSGIHDDNGARRRRKRQNNGTSTHDLALVIAEIIVGAMSSEKDPENDLLRNYVVGDNNLWNHTDGSPWFGEVSGTAAITASVYRLGQMGLLESSLAQLSGTYGTSVTSESALIWADQNYRAVVKRIDPKTGIASPAANPLDWNTRTPFLTGSPEGQSFIGSMYSSRKDCVKAGGCEALMAN